MTVDTPRVRATGILIEEGKILLLEQHVTESSDRGWSLPGGGLNFGETIEECLIREMQEETGLKCEVLKLLYVCDRIQDGRHVLHLTLLLRRISGELSLGYEPEVGANKIHSLSFVDLGDLEGKGFSKTFSDLAQQGFPGAGSYAGPISNIGL